MSGLVNVYKARISVPWRQLVENGSKAQALAVAFLPTSFILLRWYSLSACNVPSPGLMWDRGWALALPLWIFEVLLFMLLLGYRKESKVVVAPRPFSAQQWQCWGTYAWHILFPQSLGVRTSLFFTLPLAGLSALARLFDLIARGSWVTWLSIAETDRSDFCGRHSSWLCTARPELSCFDSSLPGISFWPTNRWHTATLLPLSCPEEVQAVLTQDPFCRVHVYLPYCSALSASSGKGFLGRGDEKAWRQQHRRWESGEREAAESFI